jgi:hypothetical protein
MAILIVAAFSSRLSRYRCRCSRARALIDHSPDLVDGALALVIVIPTAMFFRR